MEFQSYLGARFKQRRLREEGLKRHGSVSEIIAKGWHIRSRKKRQQKQLVGGVKT